MAIYRVAHEIHCLDWIKRQWTVYKDERPELVEHLGKMISAFLSLFPLRVRVSRVISILYG